METSTRITAVVTTVTVAMFIEAILHQEKTCSDTNSYGEALVAQDLMIWVRHRL